MTATLHILMKIYLTVSRLIWFFIPRRIMIFFALVSLAIVGPLGHSVSSEIQENITSIRHLFQHPKEYHQQIIRLRGTITRLELHLDDTQHFIDFVFFLKEGEERVLVFGRHDRTLGDIQLTSDRMVEVQGIFWQERFANGHRFENNVEAQQIHFYPRVSPDQAKRPQPKRHDELRAPLKTVFFL